MHRASARGHKFVDKSGLHAGGMTKAKIAVNKQGRATLALQGKGLDSARFGAHVDLKVRVGGRCSDGSVALKTKKKKKKKLVFP